MFRILKESNFDFMGKRQLALTVSLVLVLASIAVLVINKGVDRGIEFTGGAELQLRFADTPNLGSIRSGLAGAGLTNNIVTTIGPLEDNEIHIRIGGTGGVEESDDLTAKALAAVRSTIGASTEPTNDLNLIGRDAVERLLAGAPSLGGTDSGTLAQAIADHRREVAIFHSVDDLSSIAGMTPEALSFLRSSAEVGPLALRGQSYIFPAVGQELMNKALLAILGSLIGMLIYIWIRFQLQWGFAAVVALAHDTMIVLGLFSLFGKELTLPVVAAFLTLIGYSVNDTVVVFDRIRENLKSRGQLGLEGVINLSINQTLSRTIITSGLTWVVVFGLLIFGGSALNPFAFVLTAGVVVGTYSSIYVAAPFLVLWKQFLEDRRKPDSGSGGARAKAKKVRPASAV